MEEPEEVDIGDQTLCRVQAGSGCSHQECSKLGSNQEIKNIEQVSTEEKVKVLKEAISVATADKNSLEQSLLEQETAFKELHLKIEALNREITAVKHENKAKEVEIEALKDNIASEIAEKNILKGKVVELETGSWSRWWSRRR